ncbi:MAG TPA: hypothetical protein VGX75_15545, partial [bacterium]|nr:hypothetical protein [bacterium]
VDNTYSGFVHGSQASIMDLYEGGDRERFRVHGMLGTQRIPTYRRELAHYTHRALNTLGVIALFMRLLDLGDHLFEARIAFEASEAYQT